MIFAEARHIKIITDILQKYPYHFYVYGSRARGDSGKSSDLDLCFFDNIPNNMRFAIEEDFEKSKLPYTVDLLDLNKCDPSFLQIIKKDMQALT